MTEPGAIAAELRAVCPDEVVEEMDWDVCELMSGSLIDDDLRSTHTDVLVRTRWRGIDAYVFVLAEHQSSPDKLMPFRILEYIVGIWRRYLNDNGGAGLPAVIPIVVFCDPRGLRWNAPTDIADMIDLPPRMRPLLEPHLPRMRLLLDDLNAVDLPALRARNLPVKALVMQWALKTVPGNEYLGQDLREIFAELRELHDGVRGDADWMQLLAYLRSKGRTHEKELIPVARELGPRALESLMTTADMLRAEGEARGEVRWRAASLLEQLSEKFGQVSDQNRKIVLAADTEKLQVWSRRVLSAQTVSEVLDEEPRAHDGQKDCNGPV